MLHISWRSLWICSLTHGLQKCYTLHNHSTLVAIIAGLRSEWASRAMRKHWRRVNVYNLRMLNDLSSFVGAEDEFMHLRGAVRALEEPAAPSEDGAALPACVPFIGSSHSNFDHGDTLADHIRLGLSR